MGKRSLEQIDDGDLVESAKRLKATRPPKVGPTRAIIEMGLSWKDHKGIKVRVGLDTMCNVPIISQDLIDAFPDIPIVVRENPATAETFDGEHSSSFGQAYTWALTLRHKDHFVKENFEITPLQKDHDILLPWWWVLQHPTKFTMTGKLEDLVFDSPKCCKCTKASMDDFTIDIDETIAEMGRDHE